MPLVPEMNMRRKSKCEHIEKVFRNGKSKSYFTEQLQKRPCICPHHRNTQVTPSSRCARLWRKACGMRRRLKRISCCLLAITQTVVLCTNSWYEKRVTVNFLPYIFLKFLCPGLHQANTARYAG